MKRIDVRTWNGSRSATMTDMSNAGKRGKRCAVLRFSGVSYPGSSDLAKQAILATDEIMDVIEGFKTSETLDFGTAAGIVEAMVAHARKAGIPEGYVSSYRDEVRGVDAPVPKLVHCVPGVFSAVADNDGLTLTDLADHYNEWTEITPSSQQNSHAYRLAAKVWSSVAQCSNLHDAANVLRAAGCKLHGFCAVD